MASDVVGVVITMKRSITLRVRRGEMVSASNL